MGKREKAVFWILRSLEILKVILGLWPKEGRNATKADEEAREQEVFPEGREDE